MWTVPNILTIFRLILVPVFLWLVTRGTLAGSVLALATFAIAGITDSLDGYIARKYGSDTDLGRFLDPLADKLLVLSAFYWAALGPTFSHLWFNIWLVHVIALREIIITTLRTIRRLQGRQVVTALEGKTKATFQMIVLSLVLTLEAGARVMTALEMPSVWIDSLTVWILVQSLFAIAVILTVVSGIRYFTVNVDTDPLTGSGESGQE